MITLEEYNHAIKVIREFHSQVEAEIEKKQANVVIGDYVHHIKGNGNFIRNKKYEVIKLSVSKRYGPVFGIMDERPRLTWIEQRKLNIPRNNGGVWVKSDEQ